MDTAQLKRLTAHLPSVEQSTARVVKIVTDLRHRAERAESENALLRAENAHLRSVIARLTDRKP